MNKTIYNKLINKSVDRIVMVLSTLVLCFTVMSCGKTEYMLLEDGTLLSENNVGESESITREAGKEQTANEQQIDANKVYVYVCGAVNEEGVYVLTENDRVDDAIKVAGGFREDACRNALNLSSKLQDEQRIYVATMEETETAILEQKEQEAYGVNINTADANKLMELNGIGETRAKAIITYREEHGSFESIEDIQKVSGIGPSCFAKIKDEIRVK